MTVQKNSYQTLWNELKEKNRVVHDWLVARGITLDQLSKNTTHFITAASFLLTLPKNAVLPPPDIDLVATESHTLDLATKPKSDLARAQKIWSQYGQFIRESAATHDLDPNLIFATIMIESGGNPNAVRYEPRLNDASYGLGQLLYSTARGLGYRGTPAGLYDPATNIDLIARYHRRNLDRHGHFTPQQLTIAYNTGSPYKKPYPGHLAKFNKWYNRVENLEVDLT